MKHRAWARPVGSQSASEIHDAAIEAPQASGVASEIAAILALHLAAALAIVLTLAALGIG